MFKSPKGPPHPRREPQYPGGVRLDALRGVFADCADFEVRELVIPCPAETRAALCYIDGLVDGEKVSDEVLRPLTEASRFRDAVCPRDCIELVALGAVWAGTMKERRSLDDTVRDLLKGYCAVIFDSEGTALTFEARTGNSRSVTEPSVEKSVKGAKDAFVETLRTNTSLLRRKLRCAELRVHETVVGRKSRTTVSMLWVDGVADPAVVGELQRRVDAIDIDGLLAAEVLEEYIADDPRSPFPQFLHTERPDKLAINLLEGRVGLIVDGLPIAFVLPATLREFMKVPEDLAQHRIVASGLTLLRWLALLLTVTLPAFYVAVAMYHQEMIPTKLLLSVIESKQEVPFSTAAEVLGMLVAFELLQEAGLRLPTPVGSTVSIIGALIVGQSAVDARVISPIAVIVVALAGIAGYTQPSQDMAAALRVTRFLLVVAAVAAGMFGIMAGLVALIWRLCGINSFGVAYTSPVTDGRPGSLRRTLFQPRQSGDKYRDPALNTPDKRRQR